MSLLRVPRALRDACAVRLTASWPDLTPGQLSAWRAQRHDAYRRRVPLGSVLAAVIFGSFTYSDAAILPDVFDVALVVRFGVVCPVLLLVWLVQVLVDERSLNPVLVEVYFCLAAVITMSSLGFLQVLTRAPSGQSFFVGFFPVLLYFVVAVWTRLWLAVLTVVVMSATAIGGVLAASVVPAVVSHDVSLTLLATFFISVILGVRREADGRRTFLLHASLAELSEVDALTGVANRRALTTMLTRWDSTAGHGLIAMLDIDHFKDLNDTHGHRSGDTCLREVATTLATLLRRHEGARIARYGGEEFVLLVPGIEEDAAGHLLERLRSGVEESRPAGMSVTVSIGWAWSPRQDTRDSATMLAAADDGVYAAKRAGRNRVVRS